MVYNNMDTMEKLITNCFYRRFKDDKPIDGKEIVSYEFVKDWEDKDSALVILPSGTVNFAFDNIEESERCQLILALTKVRHYELKTDKGIHFFFKEPNNLKFKEGANVGLCCSFNFVDIKHTSRILKNGQFRKWLVSPSEKDNQYIFKTNDLDEVPFWLYPLPFKAKIMSMMDLTSKDECRHQSLFDLISLLARDKKFNLDMVKNIVETINHQIFSESLPEQEIKGLLTAFEKYKGNTAFESKDTLHKFNHDEMAKWIMSTLNLVFNKDDSKIYVWDGKKYSVDSNVIREIIVNTKPDLKANEVEEVIKRIELLLKTTPKEPVRNHTIVSLNNGMFDYKEKKLFPHSPMYWVTHVLNTEYKEKAYCPHVDTFLNQGFVELGDIEQRQILEEYLAYTIFFPTCKLRKMLYILGTTKNGKSTLLRAIKNFIGNDNTSDVNMGMIDEKEPFYLAKLWKSIANFDIDGKQGMLKDTNMAQIKRLVDDNVSIEVNMKHKDLFSSPINCKLWVASNFTMRTQQNGEEWINRVLFLRMERKNINVSDWNYFEKLITPQARSYWLQLACEGYDRLVKKIETSQDEPWSFSKQSEREKEEYINENNSVYYYIFKNNFDINHFDNVSVKALYKEYKEFCSDEDEFKVRKSQFEDNIRNKYSGKLEIVLENNEPIFKLRN